MTVTDINDSAFTYSGTWNVSSTPSAFSGDEHFSNVTGNFYTVTATCTQFKLFSMKHPNYGIMGVSIDGGTEVMVDAYAPARVDSAQVFASPVLTRGAHTLKVRVTGNKNASALYTYVSADRVQVVDEAPTTTHSHSAEITKLNAADDAVDAAITQLQTTKTKINEVITTLTAEINNDPLPPSVKVFLAHEQAPPPVSHVVSNIGVYETLPFDGSSLVGSWSDAVLRQVALDEAAVRSVLNPLGQVATRFNRCMPLVYATPFGRFQDYSIPAANFGKLAAAIAGNPNIYGIKFDVEEYFNTQPWDETWDPSGTVRRDGQAPNPSERAAAHAFGKAIMEAMITRNPLIKVMVTFGAYVSSTEAFAAMNGMGIPGNDVAWANPYQGNVFAGMVEATIGTSAELIDGGEIYYVPTTTDREEWKAYMKGQFKTDAPYIVTSAVAGGWSAKYPMGWGTYDWPGNTRQSWTPDPLPYGPTQVRQENTEALATTERVVWWYTERYRLANNPQSGKPAVPADWMQALSDAYASK